MSFYKADMAVEMKLKKKPPTIADQRAHPLIVEGLNHLTPKVALLSEEAD
jgi:3'(2'), 5'-bisphosphate nucleotidase